MSPSVFFDGASTKLSLYIVHWSELFEYLDIMNLTICNTICYMIE